MKPKILRTYLIEVIQSEHGKHFFFFFSFQKNVVEVGRYVGTHLKSLRKNNFLKKKEKKMARFEGVKKLLWQTGIQNSICGLFS